MKLNLKTAQLLLLLFRILYSVLGSIKIILLKLIDYEIFFRFHILFYCPKHFPSTIN